MDSSEQSLKIFETLSTDLTEIYEMAVQREDLLSEDFSASLYSEIRDLRDRYGQRKLIGKGGMKQVYKVEDKTTGRFVAMAQVREPSDRQNERFLREARLTATLEHPNIMPVYDIGIDKDGLAFFTMKMTGDKNLHEILKTRISSDEPWPLVQRLNLFLGICEGLAYAHSRHVLHLDIKPQNVLVGEFGEVLICDWGLGKILFDEDDEDEEAIDPSFFNEMTIDGIVKGTPGYMAPEQVDKKLGDRNQQTDIYALGGILYALLSGEAPVKGDTVEDVFGKTTSGEIQPLKDFEGVSVPGALAAVAMKALSCNQAERYTSVEEVISEIESFMGGFSTTAENAGFLKNFYLFVMRHKAVSFFIFLIAILSSVFVFKLQKSERQARELLTLYEDEKKQNEMISKDASPHLATQALRYLYSYDFELSRDLAEKAVLRDKSNKEAKLVKGLMHFYTQEFNKASRALLKAPKSATRDLILKLSEEFSQYKKPIDRLSPEYFNKLLFKLPTLSQRRVLFRNEVQNYSSVTNHMKIIPAMLLVNNPHVKKVNFSFVQKDGKNILDLSGNSTLEQVGCIRKMPLHKLNVEGTNLAYRETLQMRGMPLEELNIAGTRIKSFSFLKALPNLKKLVISKGACPPELLAELRAEMEVIEK
ncbi:MAG: protein kinase [Lentisphaeraceae bacterium]|nr:protein kinase [Lentisphaeraceae bacterium]